MGQRGAERAHVPTHRQGPMKEWLFKIGKSDSPRCAFGGIQNAAHLMASGCVGGENTEMGRHMDG